MSSDPIEEHNMVYKVVRGARVSNQETMEVQVEVDELLTYPRETCALPSRGTIDG